MISGENRNLGILLPPSKFRRNVYVVATDFNPLKIRCVLISSVGTIYIIVFY